MIAPDVPVLNTHTPTSVTPRIPRGQNGWRKYTSLILSKESAPAPSNVGVEFQEQPVLTGQHYIRWRVMIVAIFIN